MTTQQVSIGSAVLLTEKQQQTLMAVLNLIIPPSDDGRMPGAAEYDIWGYVGAEAHPLIRDQLERLNEQALAQHDKPFAALDEAAAQSMVTQIQTAESDFMRDLANQTVACYYQQDRVLIAIGMEARAPFPRGYEVAAGDLSLLDPVRARGRVYRQV
jgi:hypothetical protein